MMYLVAWLIGAIMGVFTIALMSAGADADRYSEGYQRGYIDGINKDR